MNLPVAYTVPVPSLTPAYVALTSGSASGTYQGSTITIPAQRAVINGSAINIAAQSLTPPLPSNSRTIISASAGVITYPNAIQYFGLLQFTITNNSGSTITAANGTITLDGCDEHIQSPSAALDTLTLPASLTNTSSVVIISNKYFGPGSGAGAIVMHLSSALQAAGVTVAAVEYQFRGNLKISATGLGYAWDNNYVSGEMKFAQFEANSSGLLYVQDWRLLGPLDKAQRVGSEVVDWSSYTPEGPPTNGGQAGAQWGAQCAYAMVETLDGHLILAGNGAVFAEWDGQSFISYWSLPGGLTANDHVTSMATIGLGPNGHEIVYIGTGTGKFLRWDRTTNTYATISSGSWSGTNACNRMIKGLATNSVICVGESGQIAVITDGGSSASMAAYAAVAPQGFNATWSDNARCVAYFDNHFYVGGGASSGNMRLWQYNAITGQSFELTNYLPGTQAERGATSSASSVVMSGICSTSDGRLLMVGSSSSGGMYLAEWDTRQIYAKGRLQFTTTGAQTIPAGTVVSNGTIQFETLEQIVATGAGTSVVQARALSGGYNGFAAYNTVTTVVTAGLTNVSAVTNVTPFGLGRVFGAATSDDLPNGLLSNLPLDISWTGRQAIVLTQKGDVISWDGLRLRTLQTFSFKGRATMGFRHTRCHFVIGDEGKVFSLPH
jgi:hypothetical protein